MRRDFKPKKNNTILIRIIIIFVLLSGIGFITGKQLNSSTNQETVLSPEDKGLKILKAIDTTNLSPLQTKVLQITKDEYAKSPTGYDKTVMKYTEGFDESWCADFISWVLNKAGSPNISSDTGYWRIPGVLSLQTYYKDMSGYRTLDEGYSPKLGDVAFYIGRDTPDASSSEHAAIVLSFDGNSLVTIGGNEGDKRELRVRSEPLNVNRSKGLVGYGVLE